MAAGTSVHLKLLGVGLGLLLVTSPVSSNCVKMKEVHLSKYRMGFAFEFLYLYCKT